MASHLLGVVQLTTGMVIEKLQVTDEALRRQALC
jgi:hypothetical protein